MVAEDRHERGECDTNCAFCDIEAEAQERHELFVRAIEEIKDHQNWLTDQIRIEAEHLSCTGPTVIHIEIPRHLLHTLEVGPEVVTMTLAEEVP